MKKKRGQMELSFGMIFSVILIIAFVVSAFYAINKFLDLQKHAEIAKFVSNFQEDINTLWKSNQGLTTLSYNLPSNIQYVCVIDFNSPETGNEDLESSGFYKEMKFEFEKGNNLVFYPIGSASNLGSVIIKNIDLEKTTSRQNPLCIKTLKGKISLRIQINYGESLVTIIK